MNGPFKFLWLKARSLQLLAYSLLLLLLLKHQFLHLCFIFLLLLQIEHGTEDKIPDGGAYTKALFFILVMMQVVVAPQRLHPFERRVPSVNGVVHRSIHQVAQNKAREENKNVFLQNEVLNAEQSRSENKAWQGRHKQTLAVAGIMVVIAVHDVHELSGTLAFGTKVKGITVCQVFKKRPEEHGADKPGGYFAPAKSKFTAGVNGKTNNKRKVHSPNDQRVSLGKKFQHRILEKLCLAFVVDFLKLHTLFGFACKFKVCGLMPLAVDGC